MIVYIHLKKLVHVDIDDPIEALSLSPKGGPEPNPEQVAMLADMGFTSAQARKALRETVREKKKLCLVFSMIFFLEMIILYSRYEFLVRERRTCCRMAI
jgi:hypothetical protein